MTTNEPDNDPQDAVERDEPTSSAPSVPILRWLSWLTPTLIVIACWFASTRAASAAFGLIDQPESASGFSAILFVPLIFVLKAALAAGCWIAVWMVGVLAITTWNEHSRPK